MLSNFSYEGKSSGQSTVLNAILKGEQMALFPVINKNLYALADGHGIRGIKSLSDAPL